MEEQKISIQGIDVNYKSFGRNGQPVLVLHGWGKGSDAWVDFAQAMAKKNYRVVVPDLPGFGKTPAPSDVWAMADYLRFIENFVLELQLGKIDLLGHSFGGGLAALFVAHDPSMIQRLVLVDAAVIRKTRLNYRQAAARMMAAGKNVFMKLPFAKKLRPWAEKIVYKIAGAHDYEKAEGIMRETFKNILSEDLRSAAGFVKIPSLIIWGDNDDSTPLSDARDLNNIIAGSSLKVIEGCGHNPHVTHPFKLADMVSGFILNS